MVKNVLLVAILGALLIVGYLLLRPPGPPPPPPGGPPGHPPPPNANVWKTRRGVVAGYSNNAHLDVNAIRIRTANEGELTIDFRPHTAKMVLSHAAIGDSVEISSGSKPNDEYVVYQLHRIRNLRTGEEADLDALPPPPDIPVNYTAENFTLAHPQLLTDPYGGIDGIRSGDLLFHFKPGLVDDISGLIKSAGSIVVSAVRRSDDFGFVNVHHDKVYIVLSVTIDHKTFLVR